MGRRFRWTLPYRRSPGLYLRGPLRDPARFRLFAPEAAFEEGLRPFSAPPVTRFAGVFRPPRRRVRAAFGAAAEGTGAFPEAGEPAASAASPATAWSIACTTSRSPAPETPDAAITGRPIASESRRAAAFASPRSAFVPTTTSGRPAS